MSLNPVVSRSSGRNRGRPTARMFLACAALMLAAWSFPVNAVVLWSDSGATLAHNTGTGRDILEGAVKRDDSSNDTLYFKFHLNPLSDTTTEEYFAAFELYEGDAERLGVGNALKAWAYSAFFNQDATGGPGNVSGYIDFHSSKPEEPGPGTPSNYELPRRGEERTIVFKVQYVAGGDDIVTVWLNPDLGPGANEVYQSETLTTRFNGNASFDELHLRHGGGGGGWVFSDMAIATSFNDFVDTSSAKPRGATTGGGPGAPLISFQSWQREEGMPHNSIRALAQTRDGYLWVGGDDGLARFDGVRFVPRETHDSPVRALLGDSHGALWIGTATGGLMHYQDGEMAAVAVDDLSSSNSITALAEDADGRIWVGTESGLAVLQDGRSVTLDGIENFQGKSVTALFNDRRGSMWIGAADVGVFQFKEGKVVQLNDSSVNTLLRDSHCLLADRGGQIWVGAGDDFVLCRENDQWRRYRLPRHSPRPYVTVLAEEPDGTVWAGSVSEGLFQFKAGRLAAVNAGSGLLDNLIGALLVDREGKLWVGTDTGLNRLQHRNLFMFGQDEGVGQGAVLGLAEVSPGVIWALKPDGGLYRWEGKNFSRLTAAGLSPNDTKVGALLVARDGSCWVACTNGLLHFKDPQAVADESRLLVLKNLSIISLAEDNDGRIWAGTREGELWRLGYGKWVRQMNLRQSSPVTAIVQDTDGSMWIGTDGSGLFRYKDDVRSHFDKNNGLASDSVRTLYLSAHDVLWIGTGGGLSRWHDNQIINFTTREGLPDNTVSQILEDYAGRLWIGGNRGIACVGRREMDELVAGKINAIYPHVYGRADGMLSEECTSGFFPGGLKIKSGLLWFSTTRGIAMVDPHHHPTNAPLPSVMLEEVLVDGIPNRGFRRLLADGTEVEGGRKESKALRIPPGKHRFEIQYTSLSFDAPEQVRFRYRLEGLDADWVEAGTRRTAFYNYVPPGEYRFSVIASGSDGAWNESGTSLELVVSRHFWQKWWVIALAAIGLLISVGGSVRIVEKKNLQRRLKRLEQERALERERTRIAQDLHDEMGAKLCRISFLSEHARRGGTAADELQNQIASISDASREVLHSLDEIVWAVNPQNDTLEHVASYVGQYAQDYFQNTGVECELDIPEQLPPHPISSQARHHLFLAVNEAFTNTLKHSRASRCTVTMSCNATAFEIRVSDNGEGFEPSAMEAGTAASGNGLRNMRQRLTDIGGECRIESTPGNGTTVLFLFPLKELIK